MSRIAHSTDFRFPITFTLSWCEIVADGASDGGREREEPSNAIWLMLLRSVTSYILSVIVVTVLLNLADRVVEIAIAYNLLMTSFVIKKSLRNTCAYVD